MSSKTEDTLERIPWGIVNLLGARLREFISDE